MMDRPKKNKGNSKMINQRRFSDEQIKSLESMFESQTKLEPRKKIQLARDLELQPRQVSIWFQNRRARWKSKQIEREFKVLKANYDHLAFQFESLKKEKQALLIQLEKLNKKLKKPNGGLDCEDIRCQSDSNPSFSLQEEVNEKTMNNKGSYGDERKVVNISENEDYSRDKWCNFGPYDHQSYANSQWCNFWT